MDALITEDGKVMDKKITKPPLDEKVARALNHLAGKGKDTFQLSDWTEAVGGNRVRACKVLKDLRADGRVARVADDAYLIV